MTERTAQEPQAEDAATEREWLIAAKWKRPQPVTVPYTPPPDDRL